MGLRFIGQPFAGGGQIGHVITAALADARAQALWIATAWGKQSGLGRILNAAAAFREAGGTSEVIVGIDEGGATREGLEMCLDVFDRVFVYHDPGTRTFHPKIYAVDAGDHATVLVGSGNLTRGGLYTNYEAAFVLEAERGQDEWAIRGEVRQYFDSLLAAGDAIRPLDADLIDLLAEEGWVMSEARQNRRRAAEGRERPQRQRLFGSAVPGLAGAPAPNVPALPDEDDDADTPMAPTPPAPPAPPPVAPTPARPAVPPPPPAAPTVVATWSKVMSRADAQQPTSTRTNPTGLLRLAQAGQDIDHRTWFRHVLFGSAPWAPSVDRESNNIEIATVPLHIVIDGASHGVISVVVDHAPHREEGQGNVLSILHWGPTLAPLLRATDYHDHTVTLSHLSDGSYRLEIA